MFVFDGNGSAVQSYTAIEESQSTRLTSVSPDITSICVNTENI